ncbi:hypothetical protein JYU34_000272 [Plutella xylostella]|uniref:Reverse transcriptase domain-containing protein n=1 Tax=Plutella xylostella TaxID=51655 RepID=A0ABQ7R797_PLUXY|nr:hypothetical protein JYU34_000272 [Plutella xylostella]
MVLFADDSTAIIKCTDINLYENKINYTLEEIMTWLNNNNLIANLNKTKIIQFHQRKINCDLNIEYNGIKIEEVQETKFLGLIMDSNLSWKGHAKEVCERLSKYAYLLHKLSKIVCLDTALNAYHGFVSSNIRYGIIFWGNCTDKDVVFRAQKRCVRAMCGLKTTDSCAPHFKRLNLLTMPSIYIYI